jgi:hypothetical protein
MEVNLDNTIKLIGVQVAVSIEKLFVNDDLEKT